jgi:hypothetical protein
VVDRPVEVLKLVRKKIVEKEKRPGEPMVRTGGGFITRCVFMCICV